MLMKDQWVVQNTAKNYDREKHLQTLHRLKFDKQNTFPRPFDI